MVTSGTERVNGQKHLGFILDEKLSFAKHINEKIKTNVFSITCLLGPLARYTKHVV